MKAIILAAGEGRRLRPFTHSRPKVMINVANKPIVGYVVDALVANGIKDIVMVVGYKKEHIMSHFEDGRRFGASITYVEQDKQIGMAHALTMAKPHVDSDFIVLPGDNIIDDKLVHDIANCRDTPALAITDSEMPSKYGVVQLSGDRVTGMVEKPEKGVGRMISTGIFKLHADAMDYIQETVAKGHTGLSDVTQEMMNQGTTLYGVRSRGIWIDAVYPWDLVALNEMAMRNAEKRTAGTVEPGAIIKGDVAIGKDVIIRSNSYIVGPVIIGDGSEIGPFVHIEPATSIGENVKISPFTSVSNSVIGSDVTIGKGCILSSSVLDDGTTVGPSFTADSGWTSIEWRGGLYKVENIGVMVGEDAKIGPQVSAAPGTVVGADCRIAAGKSISGNFKNGTRVM